MTTDIREAMMRNLGMMEADKEHASGSFNEANFGNIAEAVMAMCASSFIISKGGDVSVGTVEEIFINSLERGTKEKTYNLSGKNNIFDIKGAGAEREKSDMNRREKAAILQALEKVALDKNHNAVKVKWGNFGKSYYNELEKWKLQVNGKNVIAFAFTAPKKFKIVMDKNNDEIKLNHDQVIEFFNKAIDSYFPGMVGSDNGRPLKAASNKSNDYFVKYKVVNDDEMAKFMKESVENETDDGFIPKLVISTNHNVIPTIQDILIQKNGEKYDELVNMMDTIVEYFIEGENDITKIRNIYQKNVHDEKPSFLVIRMMGGDGQGGDGKGNVKGDIQLSIKNSDGKTVSVVFSMKYGNHTLHKFTSNKTIIDGVTDVYDISGLDNQVKNMREWKETVETYGNGDVEDIVGIDPRESVFEETEIPRLAERLMSMSSTNTARMLFGFLERFAIGVDKASILRTDKNGKKWHVIPSLISDYISYQDGSVFVNRRNGVNVKMGVKDGEDKIHGILKLSDSVTMDGGLQEFVEKVQKVFTQPRTDMWTLISYYRYMKRITSVYSKQNPVPSIVMERIIGMVTHASEIRNNFPKAALSAHKIIMNDMDSKEFKKSNIMTFMNGDSDTLDPKEIASFITIMIDKVDSLYKVISSLPTK